MKDLWDINNRLESLIYRVSNAADLLAVLAGNTERDPESGALWFVSESLKDIVTHAETELNNLMDIQRAESKKK